MDEPGNAAEPGNAGVKPAEAGAADQGSTTATLQPGPWEKTKTRARARRSTALLAVLAIVGGLAFATVFAYGLSKLTGKSASSHLPRPSGIPAGVSTSLAYQMQLSTVPARQAPGFTLTDQNGHPVSMAGLHGKTVVLTFMDSHCTDICPFVSREFLDARRDLGAASRNVVFVAVDVNPYHAAVADVASFTRRMGLGSIPTWHFVTGSLPALRKVWKDYLIYVRAQNPHADVQHTSLIYFISPKGQERYVAAPMVDHTRKGTAYLPPSRLAEWGRGIAQVASAVGR
jgi:protein SCO1